MILETTLALIMLGARPPTKEFGWLKSDSIVSHYQPIETESTIIQADQASIAMSGAYIQDFDTAISRFEWLKSEISAYGFLSDGWDGENSVAPSASHLAAAASLLNLLPAGIPLPRPMLSSSGELGLYWDEPSLMGDAVIESDTEFSLFLRARERGGKESFHEQIYIGATTSDLLKEAFESV